MDKEADLQGSVGLRISKKGPPFLVEAVDVVIDEQGCLQGHRAYKNPIVNVHDRLVAVDGCTAETMERLAPGSIQTALKGPRGSIVELAFISAVTGSVFSIRVARHMVKEVVSEIMSTEALKDAAGIRQKEAPCGIGVIIGRHDFHDDTQPCYILKLSAGGSALQSGEIDVGDEVLAVGGMQCFRQALPTISSRIVGPQGTTVELKVKKARESFERLVKLRRKINIGQSDTLTVRLDALDKDQEQLKLINQMNAQIFPNTHDSTSVRSQLPNLLIPPREVLLKPQKEGTTWCKTIASYTARNPDELSFSKGQLIEIEKGHTEPGWYRGTMLTGAKGLVPVTHVRIKRTKSSSRSSSRPLSVADSEEYGHLPRSGPFSQLSNEDLARESALQARRKPLAGAAGPDPTTPSSASASASLFPQGVDTPLPSQEGKAVDLQLKLGLDFMAAGEQGSPARALFEQNLTRDLSQATSVHSNRFVIKKVSPGSVIVDLEIVKNFNSWDMGPEPQHVAADLERQVHDPNSPLRNGWLTCYAVAIVFPSYLPSFPGNPEQTRYKQTFVEQLKQFYNVYNPRMVPEAGEVADSYNYDFSTLNQALLAKYGACLKPKYLGSTKSSANPALLALFAAHGLASAVCEEVCSRYGISTIGDLLLVEEADIPKLELKLVDSRKLEEILRSIRSQRPTGENSVLHAELAGNATREVTAGNGSSRHIDQRSHEKPKSKLAELLTVFYTLHAPEKLQHVNDYASMYSDNLPRLNEELARKYCAYIDFDRAVIVGLHDDEVPTSILSQGLPSAQALRMPRVLHTKRSATVLSSADTVGDESPLDTSTTHPAVLYDDSSNRWQQVAGAVEQLLSDEQYSTLSRSDASQMM